MADIKKSIFDFDDIQKKLIRKSVECYDEKGENICNKLFSSGKINNFLVKNRFCFLGYTKNNYLSFAGDIDGYCNFYRGIISSGVGIIFANSYFSKNNFLKKDIISKDLVENKISSLIESAHISGCKMFVNLESILGRADNSVKMFDYFSFSPSFGRNYNNANLVCMRAGDGICNKIAGMMVKNAIISKEIGFDGINIDGSLFGFIGEISSPEINRRKFGYYSEIYDFSKKVIEKIIDYDCKISIFYTLSIKSFAESIYGSDLNKIRTLSDFETYYDNDKIIEFMLILVKSGVDGFCIEPGTFETEFLSSPTEFAENGIFEKIFIKIRNYFRVNNIKNKWGSEVAFIFRETCSGFSSKLFLSSSVFCDITNALLADNNFIFKSIEGEKCRNCVRCGYCSDRGIRKQTIRCLVNPFDKILPEKTGKVAVIGAGISGLNSAIILAKMGFFVDVFEKLEKINNWSRYSEIFGFNTAIKKYNDFIEEQIDKLSKEGKINIIHQMFIAEKTDMSGYDAIIVATGRCEKYGCVPGVVLKNVKSIGDVLLDKNCILQHKNIVIDVKSELSLELAQYLLLHKKIVTLLFSSDSLFLSMNNSRLTYFLYSLQKLNCRAYFRANIVKIEEDFIELNCDRKMLGENLASVALNIRSGMKYKGEIVAKCIDHDILIYEPETIPQNALLAEISDLGYSGKTFIIGGAGDFLSFGDSIKSAYLVADNI